MQHDFSRVVARARVWYIVVGAAWLTWIAILPHIREVREVVPRAGQTLLISRMNRTWGLIETRLSVLLIIVRRAWNKWRAHLDFSSTSWQPPSPKKEQAVLKINMDRTWGLIEARIGIWRILVRFAWRKWHGDNSSKRQRLDPADIAFAAGRLIGGLCSLSLLGKRQFIKMLRIAWRSWIIYITEKNRVSTLTRYKFITVWTVARKLWFSSISRGFRNWLKVVREMSWFEMRRGEHDRALFEASILQLRRALNAIMVNRMAIAWAHWAKRAEKCKRLRSFSLKFLFLRPYFSLWRASTTRIYLLRGIERSFSSLRRQYLVAAVRTWSVKTARLSSAQEVQNGSLVLKAKVSSAGVRRLMRNFGRTLLTHYWCIWLELLAQLRAVIELDSKRVTSLKRVFLFLFRATVTKSLKRWSFFVQGRKLLNAHEVYLTKTHHSIMCKSHLRRLLVQNRRLLLKKGLNALEMNAQQFSIRRLTLAKISISFAERRLRGAYRRWLKKTIFRSYTNNLSSCLLRRVSKLAHQYRLRNALRIWAANHVIEKSRMQALKSATIQRVFAITKRFHILKGWTALTRTVLKRHFYLRLISIFKRALRWDIVRAWYVWLGHTREENFFESEQSYRESVNAERLAVALASKDRSLYLGHRIVKRAIFANFIRRSMRAFGIWRVAAALEKVSVFSVQRKMFNSFIARQFVRRAIRCYVFLAWKKLKAIMIQCRKNERIIFEMGSRIRLLIRRRELSNARHYFFTWKSAVSEASKAESRSAFAAAASEVAKERMVSQRNMVLVRVHDVRQKKVSRAFRHWLTSSVQSACVVDLRKQRTRFRVAVVPVLLRHVRCHHTCRAWSRWTEFLRAKKVEDTSESLRKLILSRLCHIFAKTQKAQAFKYWRGVTQKITSIEISTSQILLLESNRKISLRRGYRLGGILARSGSHVVLASAFRTWSVVAFRMTKFTSNKIQRIQFRNSNFKILLLRHQRFQLALGMSRFRKVKNIFAIKLKNLFGLWQKFWASRIAEALRRWYCFNCQMANIDVQELFRQSIESEHMNASLELQQRSIEIGSTILSRFMTAYRNNSLFSFFRLWRTKTSEASRTKNSLETSRMKAIIVHSLFLRLIRSLVTNVWVKWALIIDEHRGKQKTFLLRIVHSWHNFSRLVLVHQSILKKRAVSVQMCIRRIQTSIIRRKFSLWKSMINFREKVIEATKKCEALIIQFRHVNNNFKLVAIKRLHRRYKSQMLANGWHLWYIFVNRCNDEHDRKIVAKDLILRQTHASQQRLMRSRAAVEAATSVLDTVALALGQAPRDSKSFLSQLVRRLRLKLLWKSWSALYLSSMRQRSASSMVQAKRFEVVKYCAKRLILFFRTHELRILLRYFKVLVSNDRQPETRMRTSSAVKRGHGLGFEMRHRIENGNEGSLAALKILEQVPSDDSLELRSASEGRPVRRSSRSVFGSMSMMSVFVSKSKLISAPKNNLGK